MRTWTLPAVLATLVTLATPVLARGFLPDPLTDRGAIIEDIYFQIFVVGLIVFLFVFALLAFVLLRYREGSGKGRATYEKERDNLKAEATWTIIPLLIVLWVGVISYQALVDLDGIETGGFDEAQYSPYTANLPMSFSDFQDDAEAEGREAYVRVWITGHQWFWAADYGGGVDVDAFTGVSGSLTDTEPFVVPADTPIQFIVTSSDVIHSFNVPALYQTLDTRMGIDTPDEGLNLTVAPGELNTLEVRSGLPEREYFTQCKEICGTPGHSYMRAIIKAVPVEQFEQWIADQKAGAGAGLTQHVPVTASGGSLSTEVSTSLAQGAAIRFQIANDESSSLDFTFADETVTVPAGSVDFLQLTAGEVGTVPLEASNGASLAFEVKQPRTIDVGLGAFVIEPEDLQVEAGEVYIFETENVHTISHNIYIDVSGGDGVTQARWHSDTLGAGENGSFIVAPKEPGTMETWCAVPSHYNAGMHGTMTIAA